VAAIAWLLAIALAPLGAVLGQTADTAPSAAAREALSAAVKAIDAKDYATAERQFLRVTELQPKFPQGWLGLAEARVRLGRAQDALTAAERARELQPDLAAASFTVARCLAEMGKLGEALIAVDRARELEPANAESILLSALLLRQLRRDDDALKLLEEAWKSGNRDPRLAEQLAFLRFDRDDIAGAAAVAEEGLAEDPQRANLKAVLGFALAKDPARKGEAVRWLEEALAAGVGEPAQIRLELGGILLDLGRTADALPHLEEAARLLPQASAPQYRLAQARRALGDEAGAEQALARFSELEARERTTERDSKELGIAVNEAQTLATENKLVEALERLDALSAEHPDDARVAALRAKVLYSMGRRREAEQSIAAAVERMPDRAEYQYLSGLFHMYAGRTAEARAALDRALAIDDGLAPAHALLAGALVKLGKAADALPHFERAIELGADSPEVRLGYAEALKSLGRTKEAEAQMAAYRKLGAGGP
jgi:tetratricopeptide (TPR) repeat protein